MANEERVVPFSHIKEMLEEEEEERELSYEQRLALEHSKTFAFTEPKKDRKLMKKLMQIERINENIAVKIVELFPKSETEVRAIFAKERFNLEPDQIKEIVEILSEAD